MISSALCAPDGTVTFTAAILHTLVLNDTCTVLEDIIKTTDDDLALQLCCWMVSEHNLLYVALNFFQLKALMEQLCRVSTTKAVGFNVNDEVDQ